jgi:hypothetical protein
MYKDLTDEQLEYLLPMSFRRRGEKMSRRWWALPRAPGARLEHGVTSRDGEVFRLVFEAMNSDWQQMVHLEADRTVEVDRMEYRRGVLLPYDPGHPLVNIRVRTREGMFWVWNVWEHRGVQGEWRRESHMLYAGMLVDELPNGYRYRCNEGRDDDDYDDLVFRIERTGVIDKSPSAAKAKGSWRDTLGPYQPSRLDSPGPRPGGH